MNLKQKIILRKLVNKNGQKYCELSNTFEDEDRFIYHLRQLIKHNFVYKKENKYYLSFDGLKFSRNFDDKSFKEYENINVVLAFVIIYKNQYYLEKDYSEIKDENKSWYRLARGIPQFGENFLISAQRILKDKFKINIPIYGIKYTHAFHRQTKSSKDNILFDDVVFLFTIEIGDKDYEKNKRINKYQKWFTLDEISNLKNILPEIEMYILNTKIPTITEFIYENNYNLE